MYANGTAAEYVNADVEDDFPTVPIDPTQMTGLESLKATAESSQLLTDGGVVDIATTDDIQFGDTDGDWLKHRRV